MEISIVAGVISFILILVWLSKKPNEHSMIHYGYAPIGLGTIVLGMIPFILIIAGFVLDNKDPNNLFMALLFAGMSAIGLFWWVAHRSSWRVASGTVIILLLVGLPALVLWFMSRNDDYYYYD